MSFRERKWRGWTHKYFGVQVNKKKLDWTHNTETLFRKGQSRQFFLRRPRAFGVCDRLLQIYYQSIVASALLFAVVWHQGLNISNLALLRKASQVIRLEQDSVEAVAGRRTRDKIKTTLDNPSRPL